jgi:NO-binding membrane sensor protein with MHYT domain
MVHVNNFSYGALNPVLAYVMSCAGCFLGLRCTARGYASQGRARIRWLILATVAIATTGIWVMHFIAMLGFTIPGQTITYSVPVTILSMLIAVVVVGLGLSIVEFGGGRAWTLGLGGLVVGVGVASMHYLGMAAIRAPDTLGYNPVLVLISVVIAVIAGTAALWAALRLHGVWAAFVASLIMGVAVSGMHYTGMAALRVHPDLGLAAGGQGGGAGAVAFLLPLILGIGIVTFILTAVISLAPTAAEIVEEADLMARIGQPRHRAAGPQPDPFPHPNGDGPEQEPYAQPGSLFRDHRSHRRHEER